MTSVKRYIEYNTSLRGLGNSIGVSDRGLLNWAMEYGKNSKSPLDVVLELKPRWSGLLGIDGKALKIKGKEIILLIAQDINTFLLPCRRRECRGI